MTKLEILQEKFDALETKHKNLRACVSGMTQQLRALEGPYDEEQECTTSWPHVSSFGIYMQLLQALMGAKPPVVGGETDVTIAIKEQKYTDRSFRLDAEGPRAAKEARKKKFKVLD